MNVNSICLVGRAGRDPETKYFESGAVLTEFSLAVDTRKNEPPNWFSVKVWGKTAEIAANYVKKGSLVGIQGTLTLEAWKDKNTGANRSKPVINTENLRLLGGRNDNQDPGAEINDY